MSPLIKNIATILVALTLAFFGYYLYTQNKEAGLSYDDSANSTQDMLTKTGVFIERRKLLDDVEFNTDIFMNPVFQSYRSYRSPGIETPVGRPNPFEENSSSI